MNRYLAGLAVFLLSVLLAGCASSGYSTAGAPPDGDPVVDAYRIGVDDMVQVSVWGSPELGVTAPVRPDGMISVPLLGDVQAGGRTPAEVTCEIQTQLLED